MKIRYESFPFLLRFVWDPIRALDLVDKSGAPDHGKVLPACLLAAAIVAHLLGHPFATGALIVLGSLSYGYGMWRSFLQSKTVTEARTVAITESRAIKATFDHELGYQPTNE